MKIAFFRCLDVEREYFVNRLGLEYELQFFDDSIQKNISKLNDVDVLCIFACNEVSKELINQMPKLKLITTRSTGFDHIDCTFAKEKNITVCNVPAYGSNTVAEHTFGLILAISKHIVDLSNRTKRSSYQYLDKIGFDLEEKTIGVVGAGRIGRKVIQIAKGFGMHILVCNKTQDPQLAKELGFTYVDFDELLKLSDIITFHVPYFSDTHHMINTKNINKIKKGAVLINTARGPVVDTKALIKALDQKILSFVGLDVVENENDLFSGKGDKIAEELIGREDVIFTPHSAYYTKEALERICQTTVKNIEEFIENNPCNTVNS